MHFLWPVSHTDASFFGMSIIEIYTGPFCAYCIRAKALLKRKELYFTEYNIHTEQARRTEMLERSGGARTIPQIFINNRHIGGSDELYAMERSGELDIMIRESKSA